MRDVDIDPIHRTGTAQGGATAGEYTDGGGRSTGFATPFGDSASVGLGGLTLGGGIGWLARPHGMTIDNLLAVDLVTADGELRTVTEASDPDLFWALRGGGGNFGIATRFHYRLHPVSIVTGGALFLPLSAPRSCATSSRPRSSRPRGADPDHVRHGHPARAVRARPSSSARPPSWSCRSTPATPRPGAAAMAPFRALATPLIDMVGPMPYAGMYQLTAGGAAPGAEVVRSAFLRRPRRGGGRGHRRAPRLAGRRRDDDPAAGPRRCDGPRPGRRDGVRPPRGPGHGGGHDPASPGAARRRRPSPTRYLADISATATGVYCELPGRRGRVPPAPGLPGRDVRAPRRRQAPRRPRERVPRQPQHPALTAVRVGPIRTAPRAPPRPRRFPPGAHPRPARDRPSTTNRLRKATSPVIHPP